MSGNVIPSTGVSQGSTLAVRLYAAARAVKVHKTRLSDLARQCDLLLSTVREYSPRFIGTEVGTEADGIERAVERILVRVLGWAGLSDAAAFMKQNEIQNGIEECHRELATCTDRFMVALNMVKSSESQEREMARQRDHQQIFDMIAVLLEEVRNRAHLITAETSQPREQLLQTQVLEVDGQGSVPPVASSPRSKPADHSREISRLSEDPVIEGTQLVFHIGEWNSDGERTALGRLRDRSPDAQKRFKEWIEATLGLQHRNILNFIGHVTMDGIVYSVNPWMENGNTREYIQRNPDADRVRLLGEVASGVKFLHEREIVHGDLCDKNILMNRDGKAIVCGFDLFELSDPAVFRARWLAPERVTTAGVTPPTEKADIWSFGLLCLEIYSGKDPYSSYSDFYVPILLIQGTHPEHPGDTAVNLSPKMWDLMRSCWEIDPAQRPSMSRIQLTIREMHPPPDSRQPPARSMGLSDSVLFKPLNDTAPLNEPLSPLRAPILIDIPSVIQELNTAAPTITVDRQADTLAPMRRIVSDSSSFGHRPLPPLPEDPPNSDLPIQPLSAPPQPTKHGGRKQPRPSTAPDPPASSLLSGLRRQLSADSSSSQSTSSTSESKNWRLFPFSHKRSQTTPDTSPGVNSKPLSPNTPSSSTSHMPQGAPPANPLSPSRSETAPTDPLFPSRSKTTPTSPPSPNRSKTTPTSPPPPNRSKTTPTKKASKMAPSRSPTIYITLPQSRKWEPVSPVVLDFMEKAASDSESLLRPATDGTVSSGNLEGLVSRVISDISDSSRSDRFRATFLTTYQLFASSEQLFSILKRRFESAELLVELDPASLRSRYSILLVIESWLKKGFEDEELKCSSMIKELVLALMGSETISETMESKAREIASMIDDPVYVRLRQPKSCAPLRREPAQRPHGMTTADRAAALTVVEGDRFRCITYWDYVKFTRQRSNVRRIEVFNIVHDLVTVWVQTTVMRSDSLDERMSMYEEWVDTAEACKRLNNFSSTSAIVIALMSPMVTALTLTRESKAKQVLYRLAQDLTPTDGAYQNTLEQVATKEVIPWLDRHLSTLNWSFAHSSPIVEVDGHPFVDFKQCSEIAEQIESLVQYSPPRTRQTTRPDVLAYVEYSLKSCNGDDVVRALEERSASLAAAERSLLEHRKKIQGLGMALSPHPHRRK